MYYYRILNITRYGIDGGVFSSKGTSPSYDSFYRPPTPWIMILFNLLSAMRYIRTGSVNTEEDDLHVKRVKVECELTQKCFRLNPKSYWVWYHRRWILEHYARVPQWEKELTLCHQFLDLDARNFHCWDYRRFVVAQLGLLRRDEELAFTLHKISQNFSNYSAWHQRSQWLFAASQQDDTSLETTPARVSTYLNWIQKDFELIKSALYTEPADQSAWLYHHWLTGQLSLQVPLVSAQCVRTDHVILMYLHFDEPLRIPTSVTLSSMQLHYESVLSTHLRKHQFHATWRAPNGNTSVFSPTWMTCIPALPFDELNVSIPAGTFLSRCARSSCSVTLRFKQESDQVSPISEAHLDQGQSGDRDCAFAMLLEKELSDMEELLELEPESRFCLLTTILLINQIGRQNNWKEKVEERLRLLQQLDTDHKQFYSDLGKRLQLESILNDSNAFSPKATGMQLTSLPRSHLCCHITSLDLSYNRLTSMDSLLALVRLEELKLNDNFIDRIPHLLHLVSLKRLSLENNQLKSKRSLMGLGSATQLGNVLLKGNEVMQEDGIDDYIQELLSGRPRKRILDTICLSLLSPPDKQAYCVGALLVDCKTDKVVSTGFSRELGDRTHAEECALEKFKDCSTLNETPLKLYTSMEPCSSRLSGQLSCSERILQFNQRRIAHGKLEEVVIGAREPDFLISNCTGAQQLSKAGLNVQWTNIDATLLANHHFVNE